MSDQMLTLKQAAISLYGPSTTKNEENEKYIKLLCLTDKGLKTHRVFELLPDGKQQRRVKIKLEDLDKFRLKQ